MEDLKGLAVPSVLHRPMQLHLRLQNFLITRKKHYGVATVDGETLLASQGKRVCFLLDAATTEIDQVAKSVGDALSTATVQNF